MNKIVKWGVLSTARIAVNKVIPAMQRSKYCEISAIASRTSSAAEKVSASHGIPRHYGSYTELLEDKNIDAVYNPLPHHLHYEWTMKCLEAGKHVLCEKPLALSVDHVRDLMRMRDRTGLKVGEAFMVHTHPQWTDAVQRIRNGALGGVHTIHGFFSYDFRDPDNFRNHAETGGGGLWDIGCYPVFASRMVFGEEPDRVIGLFERDPNWNIDRVTSAILKFPSGQSTFTCATQSVPHQRMQFFGNVKMLEIRIPFNAPNDVPCVSLLYDGDLHGRNIKEIQYPVCDQYTLQGDAFAKAILFDEDVPVPLENTLRNTAVLQALFNSEKSGMWEKPAALL
jgi:predicted dehydrogenase